MAAWCAAGPGSIAPLALQWVPALRCIVTGRRGACHRARIRATRWRRRENAAPRPGHERNLLSPPSADLRAPANLLNWIKLMLAVQSSLQKYSCFRTPQITSRTLGIPPHKRRIMIVTDVGEGCGGRGSVLRAMGLQGGFFESVSDQQPADERCCCGRQNRVVLTPRRWRQVRGVASAQPGLDKTYPLMTVAKEPGHRGEHDISR
jgi:hypothetical protein